MKIKKTNQRGFFKTIVVVIVVIVMLTYWSRDIQEFLDREETRSAIKKFALATLDLWNNYLRGPVISFFNKVIVGIIWQDGLKPIFEVVREIVSS